MLDAAVDGSGGESEAPAAVDPPSLSLDSLRALAHPLRVRILHVLTTQGPQTASSLAAALGESTGSTSYHLRQLEATGYIAEDAERGTARERWWRRAIDEVEVWTKELADAPEGRAASATVLHAWTEHDRALLAAYIAGGEERYDEPTLDAARVSSRSASLPASELRRLTRDVERLIRERIAAARRADADDPTDPVHRIQIQFNAFPID
ncbi:helix-turn-helix domain-containing protein [Agrococcus sp. SCSIO52902]|uniref:ArsR/SmtB family transcription factor n=1 Tax=Agrococcus sp. SCSIO52902 TaxID=2933290 RepID=UPI001FF2DEDD|nr:helix-turn-helix domain-containing protein [Agrococcus sp. SCSIO52902]UOW00277.1 helix-turn-helix domain-containing protein [Agrococcus sp. SCSIO52902]